MSSYLVEKETINKILNYKGEYNENIIFEVFNEHNKTKLGKKLLKMNIEALKQRYPQDTDKTRPGTKGDESAKARVKEYKFQEQRVTSEQAYMSASCLSYQCSEGKVPNKRLYKQLEKLINRIANEIAHKQAEKLNCTWG